MLKACRVLVPLPLPPFSFLPPHGQDLPAPGERVVVPWQNGIRVGIVYGYEELRGARALELREVVDRLDNRPFVLEQALKLIERTARRSLTPEGTVLATLLPTGLNPLLAHQVRAVSPEIDLVSSDWTDAADLDPKQLDLWRRQGLLEERVIERGKQVRVLVAVGKADEALDGPRFDNQRQALDVLSSHEHFGSAAGLSREAEVPVSAVRGLIKKGYAAYRDISAPPPPLPKSVAEPAPKRAAPPTPVPDATVLLLSGGTRRARLAALLPELKHYLSRGESVLVLVPEHSFIPETARLLGGTLPVYVFSGDLDDAQRLRLWREVGESPSVLVTTYLGMTAPQVELGCVLVLEAGSESYKLLSGPRAYVPELAGYLAEAAGASLRFADRLPSLELRTRCREAPQHSLESDTPRVHVSDLNDSSWPLSEDLKKVLKQVEARARQAVVLAPRRGFSAALSCAGCDYIAMCPNCDLSLRYHQERYRLQCHQCGHQERLPDLCPNCGNSSLSPSRAAGTQWLAASIEKLLPDTPVYRLDSDRKDDLAALHSGESGVLVATSAALRIDPLPNVSLIAVALLDGWLNMGGFRAEENTLRMLLNLAELSPERRPLTLVQTFQAEHPVLAAFADPEGPAAQTFSASIRERRQRFHYPPYGHMAKLQLSAKLRPRAAQAAEDLVNRLLTAGAQKAEVLGPSPAPVERIRNQYCFQIFLKTPSEARLFELLEQARGYSGPAKLRIDVDPRDVEGFID